MRDGGQDASHLYSKLLEQWVSQAQKGSVCCIRPGIKAANQGGLRF